MNLRRLTTIAGTVSLAVAGGTFAGVAIATPSPSGQQYTGCLIYGSLTNVAIGPSPMHACQRGAIQISWNQTGPQGVPGSSGSTTKVYSWTVTVPGGASGVGYQDSTMTVPAGFIVRPISATATGDFSPCTTGAISGIQVEVFGQITFASWEPEDSNITNATPTVLFGGGGFLGTTEPLRAIVSCYGGGGGVPETTPSVTLTVVFAVTSFPTTGTPQTFT